MDIKGFQVSGWIVFRKGLERTTINDIEMLERIYVTHHSFRSRSSHPSILRLCSRLANLVSSNTFETLMLSKEDAVAPCTISNEDSAASSDLKTVICSMNEATLPSLMSKT